MAANEKTALHLATHSGWYRYERRGANWEQTDRALTFWQMSCIQVDPNDAKHVFAGTEHSGMFVSKDGGKDWKRAEPNVPILEMSAMLALPGKILVGTRPAALYIQNNGNSWQEVKGIRQGAFGGTFPPNPDLAPRTRVLTTEKSSGTRLYAGIEVGGIFVSRRRREPSSAMTTLIRPTSNFVSKKPGLLVAACGRSRAQHRSRQQMEPVTCRRRPTAMHSPKTTREYLSGITQDRPRTHGGAATAISNHRTAPAEISTDRMSGASWRCVRMPKAMAS
jgi:hypothetical protein